jgi:hypothetical protein
MTVFGPWVPLRRGMPAFAGMTREGAILFGLVGWGAEGHPTLRWLVAGFEEGVDASFRWRDEGDVERCRAHFTLLDCHAAARLAMTVFGPWVPLRRGMSACSGMTGWGRFCLAWLGGGRKGTPTFVAAKGSRGAGLRRHDEGGAGAEH